MEDINRVEHPGKFFAQRGEVIFHPGGQFGELRAVENSETHELTQPLIEHLGGQTVHGAFHGSGTVGPLAHEAKNGE